MPLADEEEDAADVDVWEMLCEIKSGSGKRAWTSLGHNTPRLDPSRLPDVAGLKIQRRPSTKQWQLWYPGAKEPIPFQHSIRIRIMCIC